MIIRGFHSELGSIPLTADRYGKDLIVQGPEHYMTHEGYHWLLNYYFSAVADSATVRLLFTTGSKYLHAIFFASATAGILFSVYESTSFVYEAGNAISPVNRNRVTSKTVSLTNACHTPSGSGNGTAIYPVFPVGSGGNANASAPASGRDLNEYLLKQNTKYLISCVSLAAGNNINIGTDFYERG